MVEQGDVEAYLISHETMPVSLCEYGDSRCFGAEVDPIQAFENTEEWRLFMCNDRRMINHELFTGLCARHKHRILFFAGDRVCKMITRSVAKTLNENNLNNYHISSNAVLLKNSVSVISYQILIVKKDSDLPTRVISQQFNIGLLSVKSGQVRAVVGIIADNICDMKLDKIERLSFSF